MECATPEKPEVLAITASMGWDDPDLTVGKLFRLWRWFDQHTTDGNAMRVTSSLLDRVIGVTGFVQAVADAGWLTVNEDGISLSNFDRHNGDTAKNRALTAKRVADHKVNAKGNADGNDKGNADTVTEALPRGRGRDRSNTSSLRSDVARKPRATKRCPVDFVVTDEMAEAARAECPGLDLQRETTKFRDHEFKQAHSDWVATWRNWIRRAYEAMPNARGSPPSETPYQRSMRERVAQAAGSMAHIVAAKPPGQPRPIEPWEEAIENRNQAPAIGMG